MAKKSKRAFDEILDVKDFAPIGKIKLSRAVTAEIVLDAIFIDCYYPGRSSQDLQRVILDLPETKKLYAWLGKAIRAQS